MLIAAIVSTIGIQAQTVDFFDFIENFDWNISRDDFESRYNNIIEENNIEKPQLSDTSTVSGKLQQALYEWRKTDRDWCIQNGIYSLHNLCIGNHPLTGSVVLNKDAVVFKLELLLSAENLSIEETNTIITDINQEFERKYYKPIFGIDSFVNSKETQFGVFHNEARRWKVGQFMIYVVFSEKTSIQSGSYSIMVLSKGDTLESKSDFRHANWGDDKREIMKVERKKNISKNPNMYWFRDYLGNDQFDVVYLFSNGKLYAGKYFELYNRNNKDLIDDYEYFLSLLINKYGSPKVRSNEDCKSYLDDVNHGEMKRENINMWETKTSHITLILSEDQDNPNIIYLGIEYNSKDFSMSETVMDLL